MLMRLIKTSILLQVFMLAFLAGANQMAAQDTIRPQMIYFNNQYYGEAFAEQEFTYDFDAYSEFGGDIVYSLVQSEEGMTIDPTTGVLTWTPEQEGEYFLVVRAELADNPDVYGEHPFYVNVINPNGIYFMSIPYSFAWVNEPFSFQVQAYTMGERTIGYSLTQAPEGMIINETTGLLEWTPTETGQFTGVIRAFFADDPTIFLEAEFFIFVDDSSYYIPCATINGTVLWNGEVTDIPSTVTAFWSDRDQDKVYAYCFSASVDRNGNYSLNIPAGDYYLIAESYYGYASQWYENAQSPDDATILNVECEQSYTANFNFTNLDSLYDLVFISYPDQYYVTVDEPYSYDAEVFTLSDDEIRFELINAPEGMTIDAETGLVSWTPTVEGFYFYTIKAYFLNDETKYATQEVSVYVMIESGPECAIVRGRVVDQDNQPVSMALVSIFPNSVNDSVWICRWYVTTITDEDGYYFVKVPEDQYIILAEGNFRPEFWDNVYDISEATLVDIACDDTLIANFQVEAYPMPNFFTVSGRVTSEDGNNPIMSFVEFMSVDEVENDSLLSYYHGGAYTITDEYGYYTVTLPDNYRYKAVAGPLDSNYAIEFYNNVSDYNEATVITLTGDLTDINFTLEAQQYYNNRIQGVVKDTAGNGVQSQIMAFTVPNYNDPWNFSSRTIMSTDEGEFEITNLIPGDYILFAFPMNFEFLPGYYVEDDFATFIWDEATVISVTENDENPEIHEILLQSISDYRGIARLEGDVITYINKTTKGDDSPQASENVAGVYISVLDPMGKQIDWAISDDKGHYVLDNIGVGSFKIVASKQGFRAFETTKEFNLTDKVSVKDNIILEMVTGIEDEQETVQALSVYPNPASTKSTVKFIGKNGNGSLVLTDMLGNEIMNMPVSLTNGENALTIDTHNLPTGLYIVTVNSSDINLKTLVQVVH